MASAKDFPKFVHLRKVDLGPDEERIERIDMVVGTAESAITSTADTLVATYELKSVRRGRLVPEFFSIEG